MCGGLSSRPHTHVKVAVSPASTSRAFDMFPTNLPRSSAVSLSSAAQHRPAITTGPAHPPPKKNTITARHTPHHPHASQRQGKHISTTNTYMARYRRGFAARARAYDPPCRRCRPRTSIRPRRTPHSTRLRSAARLRPSLHTQTPPQTPHKHPTPGQQPAHTHTHHANTCQSASSGVCLRMHHSPQTAKTSKSRPIRSPKETYQPHASLYRQTGAQARRLTSERQPPAPECAGAGLEQAAAPLAVRGQAPAGPRGTRAHSAGGGGARF